MIRQHLVWPVFIILTLTFISCIAQVKTHLPKDNVIEPKTIAIGQSKIIKHPAAKGYSRRPGNVYCGLLDKSANLWFGTTEDGVYRFDGKSFINFTTKDGLKDNCVFSILEDAAGNIWFGTTAGVCRYDGTTITHIPITTPGKSSLNPGVYSMLQDKSGIIWFGTANGVYRYNGKSFSRFLENDDVINKEDLHLKMVDCMLEDKNGNI